MIPISLPPSTPWVTEMTDGTFNLSQVPANKAAERNASKTKTPRSLLWVATPVSPSSQLSSVYRLKKHQILPNGDVGKLESSISQWSLRNDFGIGTDKNTNLVAPGTSLSPVFLSRANVQ
jgi:hypothetical protein